MGITTTATLVAPPDYQAATPEARAFVCNGCGTAGWKGDLVPDRIWGLNIREACNIHDWRYAEGQTQADKDHADREFLDNMLRLIDAAGGWKLLRLLRRQRAWIYYQAVHQFGGPAFWLGKHPKEKLWTYSM